jgi:hypothetical protein
MKLKITSIHTIAFDQHQINAEGSGVSAVLNFSDKETFDKYATAKGIDIELKPLTRRKLEETVEPKLNTPPKVVHE